MDEVDKIIVHSLRQIGCNIDDNDDDAFSMASFSPELLVRAVSFCVKEIRPNATTLGTLPGNMAQRFAAASALAEVCSSCGYRGDIGYQTFLYPNAVDVRRLLMFLIEQLPKENLSLPEPFNHRPIGEYDVLQEEFKIKMSLQLETPWVPQYGRAVCNRRSSGSSSQNILFSPQLNLNVPGICSNPKEVLNYMQQQAQNVFQQMAAGQFDLISSVLHKNSTDMHKSAKKNEIAKLKLGTVIKRPILTDVVDAAIANRKTTEMTFSDQTPLEQLCELVSTLKSRNDSVLDERKATSTEINALNGRQGADQAEMVQLRKQSKLHERTCVVLENPKENLAKLEGLVQTSQKRRKTLENQWQEYRHSMTKQLDMLQTAKLAKNLKNVIDLRRVIAHLEVALDEKSNSHILLTGELRCMTLAKSTAAAPRKEYTRRILEFIGSIRKQRNDIYKVLDDTRNLQKQLNLVSAQLQRQFNYTDDLLFQSAKHDVHAKKAYKLLAMLHATCNELVEMVAQTGNVTKGIRDLEVQIDCEKLKNIATNMEQITVDIRKFENVIKSIQAEIRKVENEIKAY